jgi:glycosyltransferase involved in cell wall biosynthesis
MNQRLKVLLLIPHLGGGGAEQVTAQLARHLDPTLFEVHLCLITPDGPGAEDPPVSVTVHRLEATRVRKAVGPIFQLIHRLRPQVILSNMAHLNFLILFLKPILPSRTRILIRQNTTTSAAVKTVLDRQLYRHLYPRATKIICQSNAMADDLVNYFHLPRNKLTVLANPIDISAIRTRAAITELSTEPNAHPNLLAIGRLSHEKGFDLLIKAIALLANQLPHIHLTILGTGPEETNLYQLASDLRLEQAVTFPGHANPADYYPSATLFVLSSRYEGMPNALFEAAAAGLPIVTTPCSAGVTDLLRNAPGVWIATEITPESLADTLLTSLGHQQTPSAHRRYEHPFLAPFELRTAIAAYEELLMQTAATPRP